MNTAFLELARRRRSVRGYLDKPVEAEVLDYIFEAARIAPSACNKQPWRFVVVTDAGKRAAICEKGMGAPVSNPWAGTAPVIIALCVGYSPVVHTAGKLLKGVDYRLLDAGIAGEHLCLAAAEQGLGTCWIGWFKPRIIRRILNIPRTAKPVSLITLGYPAEEIEKDDKKRLEIDQIRFYEAFTGSVT
ncbi:nitroreductase family protein [Planctomycetota bacterium]